MFVVSVQRAYVDAGVQFLLDESDTVLAYENRGTVEQGPASLDSLLMSSLSTLDRVQQLEIVYRKDGDCLFHSLVWQLLTVDET